MESYYISRIEYDAMHDMLKKKRGYKLKDVYFTCIVCNLITLNNRVTF